MTNFTNYSSFHSQPSQDDEQSFQSPINMNQSDPSNTDIEIRLPTLSVENICNTPGFPALPPVGVRQFGEPYASQRIVGCPRGHLLFYVGDSMDNYIGCKHCEWDCQGQQFFGDSICDHASGKIAGRYRCEGCNFDMCDGCWMKLAVSGWSSQTADIIRQSVPQRDPCLNIKDSTVFPNNWKYVETEKGTSSEKRNSNVETEKGTSYEKRSSNDSTKYNTEASFDSVTSKTREPLQQNASADNMNNFQDAIDENSEEEEAANDADIDEGPDNSDNDEEENFEEQQ
eukprot:GHVL01019695.1.p1 GENE.GHVL01019695.1~~GHVL01019695.1.p1  ORF type:complete len:285 (+),score=58.50 GHVL01019695.1:116-970(+)